LSNGGKRVFGRKTDSAVRLVVFPQILHFVVAIGVPRLGFSLLITMHSGNDVFNESSEDHRKEHSSLETLKLRSLSKIMEIPGNDLK
jgi:hypothetical protein